MTDPELFVVRVWRQLEGRFRASVRRVDEEETRHFSRPDDVAQFLSGAAAPAAQAPGAADPPAAGDVQLGVEQLQPGAGPCNRR